jgi:hypothetical protein
VAEEKDSWGIDKYLKADLSVTLKSKGRHLHDTHNALVETLLNDWELMIKKLPTSGFLRPAFGLRRGGSYSASTRRRLYRVGETGWM